VQKFSKVRLDFQGFANALDYHVRWSKEERGETPVVGDLKNSLQESID
jgi:hypothetical protein